MNLKQGGGVGSNAVSAPSPSPSPSPSSSPASSVPLDAALVFQILAGHDAAAQNLRQLPRCPYVVTASMELDEDRTARPAAPRRWIYVRDANERGIGFITQESLPAKGSATLRMPVAGEMLELRCTILRIRKVMGEWYEGAVLLVEEEPRLSWQALTRSR